MQIDSDLVGHSFVCNLCGHQNLLDTAHLVDPELPSCSQCASNIRMRWLAHRLSCEFFGRSIPAFDLPHRPELTGLGLSDPEILAKHLTASFAYQNTYYDRMPRFDIRSDDSPLGALDFLIASEVFEHIEPPVRCAFENAARLLKSSGVLLLTVPWVYDGTAENALPDFYDWKLTQEHGRWVIVSQDSAGRVERYYDPVFDGRPGPCLGNTREHFPELLEWNLLDRNGVRVLENRRADGVMERFENLTFHGGTGLVLEMRLFTKAGIERELIAAGFRTVEFEDTEWRPFGIVFPYPWSRPIVARR